MITLVDSGVESTTLIRTLVTGAEVVCSGVQDDV